MEGGKRDFRAVILNDFKDGLPCKQCSEKLKESFGDKAPSLATVKRWYSEFRNGRLSLEDQPRQGRPLSVVLPEAVEAVRQRLDEDNRCTYRDIATALNISQSRVTKILQESLIVKKVEGRWVPQQLDETQKQARLTWCEQVLKQFETSANIFLQRFFSIGQIWINCANVEFDAVTENAPKRLKRVIPARALITIFWDTHGVLRINSVATDENNDDEIYYDARLYEFNEHLQKHRPDFKLINKVLLHYDVEKLRDSKTFKTRLTEFDYEAFPHPAYSPDLSPFDYHLMPDIKKWLAGRKFSTRDEITCALEVYFQNYGERYFADGVKKLQIRCNKCIESKGDFIDEK